MIVDLAAASVGSAMVVFARVGAALLAMPAFGDAQVSPRLRLAFALGCTVVLAPVVQPQVALPDEPAALAALVVQEVAIGLSIGLAARLLLAVLHVAGSAMSLQSGLAAAAFFDPGESAQRTIFVTWFVLLVVPVVLATDGHHWLLQGLASSYGRWPPGTLPATGDLAQRMTRLTAGAFAAGVQIAMPLLALATLVNLVVGIMSRLMPALQAMLVAIPAQVLLALALTMATLGATVEVALRFLEQSTLWGG